MIKNRTFSNIKRNRKSKLVGSLNYTDNLPTFFSKRNSLRELVGKLKCESKRGGCV